MLSSVTHFEIYADDPGKLADFYRSVFGWQLEKAPGVDYWRIRTGSGDATGYNGGLTDRPLPRLHSWLNYVTVGSIDRTVAEVLRLGGEVLRRKTAVPRTGWTAILADPDGNTFAVWQSDPTAFPPPEPD